MKRNGHKMGHSKFQDGIGKNFFHSVVIQVLEQGHRGGHCISDLGDIQNLASQVPEVVGPALRKGLN